MAYQSCQQKSSIVKLVDDTAMVEVDASSLYYTLVSCNLLLICFTACSYTVVLPTVDKISTDIVHRVSVCSSKAYLKLPSPFAERLTVSLLHAFRNCQPEHLTGVLCDFW